MEHLYKIIKNYIKNYYYIN